MDRTEYIVSEFTRMFNAQDELNRISYSVNLERP